MLVKVRKTVRGKLVWLTRVKKRILDREYENLQHFLQTGEDLGIYSANKQQTLRFYKKLKPKMEFP